MSVGAKFAGMLKFALLAGCAALVLTGCNEEDLLPNDPRLIGTWSTGCFNEFPGGATPDLVETFTITSTSWTSVNYDYSTNNGTCSAGEVLADSGTGSFVTGGSVAAMLGAAPVTANTIDFHATGFDLYSIYYIDEAANPDVLYIGDETATVGLDGSAPDKRPTELQDWKPRPKQ